MGALTQTHEQLTNRHTHPIIALLLKISLVPLLTPRTRPQLDSTIYFPTTPTFITVAAADEHVDGRNGMTEDRVLCTLSSAVADLDNMYEESVHPSFSLESRRKQCA